MDISTDLSGKMGKIGKKQCEVLKEYHNKKWYQYWTYTWMNQSVQMASESGITIDQLGKIPIEDSTEVHYQRFKKEWENEKEIDHYSLLRVIFKIYKFRFLVCLIASCGCIAFEITNFYFQTQILSYINGENDYLNWTLLCAITLATFEFTARGFHMMQNVQQLKFGHRIGAAISGLAFSKMFKIPEGKYQKGQLQNLIGDDCQRISGIFLEIPHITSIPLLIISTFSSLYLFIGHIIWIPLGIMAAGIFVVYYTNTFMRELEKRKRKDDDDRATVLSEIIDNIKVLKMNSWTHCFEEKLSKLRKKEHYNDFYSKLLQMPAHISQYSCYYLMILSIFCTCILGFGMKLTVPASMAIWRLLEKLKWHIGLIPTLAQKFSESYVAIERLTDFLKSREIETQMIEETDLHESENAIEIEKSNFFWGFQNIVSNKEHTDHINVKNPNIENGFKCDKKILREENYKNGNICKRNSHLNEIKDNIKTKKLNKKFTINKAITLKDIELDIKKNEFVAIIGDVGSGKSSLIKTLLKETLYVDDQTLMKYGHTQISDAHEDNGHSTSNSNTFVRKEDVMDFRNQHVKNVRPRIRVDGSVSLVEQKPFVLSQTIRQNILFGRLLDEARYNRVVEAAQLGKDLEVFEAGDLTHVGEKGITLSGGQKARLSIARALYANRDIVLMDDPLSALDSHVKKLIFDEVFCRELRDRTRVIVTHAVDFLDRVDRVIVMEQGRVKLNGSYQQLMEHSYFRKIMQTMEAQDKKDEEQNSSEDEDSDEVEHKKKNYLSIKEKILLERDDDKDIDLSPSIYLQYFTYLKSGLFFILIGVGILTFVRLWTIKADYLMLKWVEEFSVTQTADSEILYTVFYVAFVVLFVDLSGWIVEVYQNYIIGKNLFDTMLSRMLNAPINLFFDKTPCGIINKRFSSDLNYASRELPDTIKQICRCLIFIGITFTFIATNAPICIVVFPFSIAIYITLMRGFINGSVQVGKLRIATASSISSHFGESIDGISTIRVFNRVKEFENKRFYLEDRQYAVEILSTGLNCWMNMRLNAVAMVFIVFQSIYCILNRDSGDTVITGIIMYYIFELQWDVEEIFYHASWIHDRLVSFYKCQKFTEIPQEAAQQLPLSNKAFNKNNQSWISKGRINFKQFSVRYRPDTPVVLKNINLQIEPSQKIGIVGRTGAGKSTLCLVLCRIIESSEGSIEIDGINISKVGLKDLRDKITIIPQEPVIFKNTLRFNLDPKSKHLDSEIQTLLHEAGLQSLLSRTGEGLNFSVAEKGTNLSAGEKALVCICRAILRKNKIVIMDEATASIDVNTEETVQKLMKQKFKDSTVITVAHRLNTIMKSDKIVVMNFGEIAEFGSPEKLLENKKSLFTEMINGFN
ncbi:unnamed protein product [Moneuplotes crassus]|uniref:Uncharacterized protein n=1 Tax=Euplotes crassus TaxID=5936 RepID=A0AAD1UAU8_EUPCR|nr:unnamed protein product [Moneuplotes crassus]